MTKTRKKGRMIKMMIKGKGKGKGKGKEAILGL